MLSLVTYYSFLISHFTFLIEGLLLAKKCGVSFLYSPEFLPDCEIKSPDDFAWVEMDEVEVTFLPAVETMNHTFLYVEWIALIVQSEVA